MNEQKLGRKLWKPGGMQKQPVLLPKKLMIGNNTIKQKQAGIPLGAALGGILKQ